jgi:hypothetical protein
MKQTAVDWLESKIIQMVNHGSDFGEDFPALAVHLNKAKEMEKEQMVDFAFKYGDLTTREIADAFDNEYKK